MKTGRNEVKPPISPSSDLGVSSGSAEEDGQGKESNGKSDAECLYGVDLFTEDHDGEEWVRCQKRLKREHSVFANYPKREFM